MDNWALSWLLYPRFPLRILSNRIRFTAALVKILPLQHLCIFGDFALAQKCQLSAGGCASFTSLWPSLHIDLLRPGSMTTQIRRLYNMCSRETAKLWFKASGCCCRFHPFLSLLNLDNHQLFHLHQWCCIYECLKRWFASVSEHVDIFWLENHTVKSH